MVKVKICGLQDQRTVDAACQMGADFLGFVFAPSKRKVSPKEVALLTRNVPQRVKKVGVFVSPSIEYVREAIELAKLDMIQIHQKVPAGKFSVPLIVAQNGENTSGILPPEGDYLLLDAPAKEFMGGNGRTFDWQRVNPAKLPQSQLILAGGLQVSNVGSAIDYFHPMAVDVSSGVETAGVKDLAKIKTFIEIVKGK